MSKHYHVTYTGNDIAPYVTGDSTKAAQYYATACCVIEADGIKSVAYHVDDELLREFWDGTKLIMRTCIHPDCMIADKELEAKQ